MYEFPENVNISNFFRFDKLNIRNKKWSQISKASKAVYPVIAVHCSSKGISFPSQQTIAILCGKTCNTVREGVYGLLGWPGFTIERFVTQNGNRSKKYHLNITPDEKGRGFAFYKWVVEGGYWSQLSSGAQSVYPVLLSFSFFDSDMYSEFEDLDYGFNFEKMIDDGIFQDRKYDFFKYKLSQLSQYSGVSKNTVTASIKQIEKIGLIEKISDIEYDEYFKIFRKPKLNLSPSLLNKKINIRYKKSMNKI